MIRIFLMALSLAVALPAAALPVITHTGAADPASEGWTQLGTGAGGVSEGPVFNDLGTGIDAWQINDFSTGGGTFLNYSRSFTGAEANTFFNDQGWSYQINLRMLSANDASDFSVFGEVGSSTTRYVFAMFTVGSELRVNLVGDSVVTVGEGVSRYNSLRLDYDPNTQLVDFFANGVLLSSGWAGSSPATSLGPHVRFGAGHSSGTGGANFSSVVFSSSASEPGTLALFAAVPLLLAANARRRRAR